MNKENHYPCLEKFLKGEGYEVRKERILWYKPREGSTTHGLMFVALFLGSVVVLYDVYAWTMGWRGETATIEVVPTSYGVLLVSS